MDDKMESIVEAEIQTVVTLEASSTENSGDKALNAKEIKGEVPKAPPSTPTKKATNAASSRLFPKFKVTWDASIPASKLRSPRRKMSQNVGRFDAVISRAQEMAPESALVEFIATSASFHDVKKQQLKDLEDDLLKVFPNNVMPANAAAWYMAKRRFYTDDNNENQLLPMVLRNYPEKFLVKNNEVHFLETYTKLIAKKKMQYMVEQGLYAYFSHKVDEYGVYFFDPYYYENTEPFHANLRLVTNIFNTHRSRLIPAFFNRFKTPFNIQTLSPYLVSISKTKTEVLSNVTGIIVSMIDRNYGIIQFPLGTGTETAMFSVKSLFMDGFQYQADPLGLPPVAFDGYKIPGDQGPNDYKWFAVLVWCGRKPNPKYCSTKEDLMGSQYFLGNAHNNKIASVNNNEGKTCDDFMRVGEVLSIQKNGAVLSMDKDSKEQAFIPGWAYTHRNTPGENLLTTTQGVSVRVGDLVTFLLDGNQKFEPYDAVGCNVMILERKQASQIRIPNPEDAKANDAEEKTAKQKVAKKAKKTNRHKASPTSANKPRSSWLDFLMKDDLDDEDDENAKDYQLPDYYDIYDSDETESYISQDEVKAIMAELSEVMDGVVPVNPFSEPVVKDEEPKEAGGATEDDNVNKAGEAKEADKVNEAGEATEADKVNEVGEAGDDAKKTDDVVNESAANKEAPNAEEPVKRFKMATWVEFLLNDELADSNVESEDDSEYVPPPMEEYDYDAYSNDELSDSEVKDLFDDGKSHFGDEFPITLKGKPIVTIPVECDAENDEKVR